MHTLKARVLNGKDIISKEEKEGEGGERGERERAGGGEGYVGADQSAAR